MKEVQRKTGLILPPSRPRGCRGVEGWSPGAGCQRPAGRLGSRGWRGRPPGRPRPAGGCGCPRRFPSRGRGPAGGWRRRRRRRGGGGRGGRLGGRVGSSTRSTGGGSPRPCGSTGRRSGQRRRVVCRCAIVRSAAASAARRGTTPCTARTPPKRCASSWRSRGRRGGRLAGAVCRGGRGSVPSAGRWDTTRPGARNGAFLGREKRSRGAPERLRGPQTAGGKRARRPGGT